MFNPTNLYEFCVQEAHLQARGENVSDETSENSFESRDKGNGKFKVKGKFKGKEKNNVAMNMEK